MQNKDDFMIRVEVVKTSKQKKQFLEFANELYKGNPYFVPPLYINEKKIFNKNYYYYDECDAEYFLAYDDEDRIVGRISAFIQHSSNRKTGEKRARFGRFDVIDSQEVVNAPFDAAVKWSKERGMEKICGPLGFSDLEREGLLIEGFDVMQTFEEQYNDDYYQKLVETYGFTKEVDWLEYQVRNDPNCHEKIQKAASYITHKNKFKLLEVKNVKELIDLYSDQVFDLIDLSYRSLYGTVDLSEKVRKEIIKQFKFLLTMRFINCILDEKGKMVAFSVVFPNIGEAMQADGGHLTLKALWKLAKILRKPRVVDMGLIAVHPDYQNRGINAIYMKIMSDWLAAGKSEHFETNLLLETNVQIQALWKYFDMKKVKRRRCFVLDI